MTAKRGPMSSKDPKQVAARYVAIWNEADPQRRREGVADLWSEDALHLLQPPQAVDASAGQMSFRPRDDASRIGDAVKFRWEGVSERPGARGRARARRPRS